ncbi:hypothetical protein DPMN_013218 [Dreissena polymorpha]|uniref:Uncharacterized protein n=1 Tax=Dreissena polymorpha TaxID=45954 RepID=A0A9D4S3K6_DREPO|nr:hypothetical protein DPMN_013218 [Dreissena polymorpha]
MVILKAHHVHLVLSLAQKFVPGDVSKPSQLYISTNIHGHGSAVGKVDLDGKVHHQWNDNIGGPGRVNYFLSTLNVPMIGYPGRAIQQVSIISSADAARQAYQMEINDIAVLG